MENADLGKHCLLLNKLFSSRLHHICTFLMFDFVRLNPRLHLPLTVTKRYSYISISIFLFLVFRESSVFCMKITSILFPCLGFALFVCCVSCINS